MLRIAKKDKGSGSQKIRILARKVYRIVKNVILHDRWSRFFVSYSHYYEQSLNFHVVGVYVLLAYVYKRVKKICYLVPVETGFNIFLKLEGGVSATILVTDYTVCSANICCIKQNEIEIRLQLQESEAEGQELHPSCDTLGC